MTTFHFLPAGMIFGVFASSLIAQKKNNRCSLANTMLCVFNFAVALSFFAESIKQSGLLMEFPLFYKMGSPFNLLFGPSIFFFAVASLNNTKPLDFFKNRDFLHFIPFGVVFLAYTPLYLASHQSKLLLMQDPNFFLVKHAWIIAALQTLHIGFYFFLSGRLLFTSRNTNAHKEKVSLKGFLYHHRTLLSLATILAFTLCLGFVKSALEIRVSWPLFSLCTLAIFLSVGNIEFKNQRPTKQAKYSTSILSEDKVSTSKDLLEKLFKEDELYRDGNLSPQKLSRCLGISQHDLSQLLNLHLNSNFHEYVNTWRVREVASQLEKKPLSKNIVDYAYDAGFNSKSTFYTAFKKEYSKTPLAYHKARTAEFS